MIVKTSMEALVPFIFFDSSFGFLPSQINELKFECGECMLKRHSEVTIHPNYCEPKLHSSHLHMLELISFYRLYSRNNLFY